MRMGKNVVAAVLSGMLIFAIIGQVESANTDENVDDELFKRLKSQGKLAQILADLNLEGKKVTGITFMGEIEETSWEFDAIDIMEGDEPIIVQGLTATNCTNYEDSAYIEVSKRKTSSHTWNINAGFSSTLGLSLTQGAEVEIPGLGKVSASTTLSLSSTWSLNVGSSWTETEYLQWNQGRDITVPPHRIARSDFIAYEQKVNTPFRLRVRCMGNTELVLSDSSRKVCLYENWNKGGPKQCLDAGEGLPEVVGVGTSSISTGKGIQIECYKGKNYKNLMGVLSPYSTKKYINLAPGANGEYPSDHFDAQALNIKNDQIKSVRTIDITLPYACIYASNNYGGLPMCYAAGEEANLTDYKGKVHSIKLFNAKVTLYDKRNLQTKDYFKEYTTNVKEVGTTYAQAFQSLKVESAVTGGESGTRFNIQDYLSKEDRTFELTGTYHGVTLARGMFQTKPSLNASYSADCGCDQLAGDSSDCSLASWCTEFPNDTVCKPFKVTVKATFINKNTTNPQAIPPKQIPSELVNVDGQPCITSKKAECKVTFDPRGYNLHELKAASNVSVPGFFNSCRFQRWQRSGERLQGKAEPRKDDTIVARYSCQ